MTSVPLIDQGSLDRETRGVLEATVGGHSTLAKVLDWARAQSPPLAVDEILTMDEYTHDVIVPYRDGLVLVYDTT